MYLAYNILNVLAIGFFLFSVARFYNRHTEYFLVLSIIFIYWIQLVISSAYIETGVYLKDIGVRSYPTGVTLRLVCMLELFLIVFSIVASRGDGCVVGANVVVARDIPPDSIVTQSRDLNIAPIIRTN